MQEKACVPDIVVHIMSLGRECELTRPAVRANLRDSSSLANDVWLCFGERLNLE